MKKPYTSSRGSDNRPYVNGPGHGMSYDAGTLWPERRLSSDADATAAAILCNEAYAQGYHAAQCDIRIALGLKE
jgi:hypothetical protein